MSVHKLENLRYLTDRFSKLPNRKTSSHLRAINRYVEDTTIATFQNKVSRNFVGTPRTAHGRTAGHHRQQHSSLAAIKLISLRKQHRSHVYNATQLEH